MKSSLLFTILLAAGLSACGQAVSPDDSPLPSGQKGADITYQINVYSFADSDGDGYGDLKGITEHLDYLDGLGATALWLSPIQDCSSYHGYDVLDYSAINPKLGSEEDFKELIDKAREKNIDIYMDYVLNHSGRGEWFRSAVSSADSPYRSFYVLSDNPTADVAAGRIDNYAGASNPGMGTWHRASGGDIGYKGRLHFKLDWNAKTITVTQSSASPQSSNPSASKWLWIGSAGAVGLYETASGIHEITIDVDTDWGFLVRSSLTSWDGGTKWGGEGGSITLGEAFALNSTTAADITFGGSSTWYFASFDQSMPDLNYGPYAKASESEAFKALAASADKWINMGVNGLRLDAVMWIYQDQAAANASFLGQWYDRCNATYKARGGAGNLYMVGEAFSETARVAPYYKGLPSLFNFSYWWTVKDRIGRAKGNDFARTVLWFRDQYKPYRADFIDAIKLSNHDEDRTGNDLGRSLAKMKLAGALLLTSPGKPFIYQGEELGYWGEKSKGDEFIRSPMKWTRTGRIAASALGGKIDTDMLGPDISVEAQLEDSESILNMYKAFARARNTCPALAHGQMAEVSSSTTALALWTMSYEGQTVLVAHNFGNTPVDVDLAGYKLDKTVVSNGDFTAGKNGLLNLGPFASVVFEQ